MTAFYDMTPSVQWRENKLIAPELLFFFIGATAPNGPRPPHYGGFTITPRHTTIGRNPLKEWSAWRRDLSLTKHRSLGTDLNAPAGVRNRNPSKRAAASLRLRQRGSGIGHCYWYPVNKVAGLSKVLLYPQRMAWCHNPENCMLETVRI
jgi:hypothetical protein